MIFFIIIQLLPANRWLFVTVFRVLASSCRRVLTTQIGFVAEPVAIPAIAAAHRCT